MSDPNPFAAALMNSDEAVRLSREWTAAYDERNRLRQRVADLTTAQQELVAAQAALEAKSLEAAIYLQSLQSALMN